MISIARTISAEFEWQGASVTVDIKVPTAADMYSLSGKTDTDYFMAFVTKVTSDDVDGWQNGVDAQAVLDTPGAFGLVRAVMTVIIEKAMLGAERKN